MVAPEVKRLIEAEMAAMPERDYLEKLPAPATPSCGNPSGRRKGGTPCAVRMGHSKKCICAALRSASERQ